MATVDRIPEETRVSQTVDGIEITDAYMVSDLAGGADSYLLNALRDTGIPDFNIEHTVETGLFVAEKNVSPQGPTSAIVTVTYRPPALTSTGVATTTFRNPKVEDITAAGSPGFLSTNSVSVSRVTSKDRDGNPMVVNYAGGVEAAGTNTVSAQVEEVAAEITATRIQTVGTLEFTRTLTNKLNDNVWSGQPAGTVFVTRIQSDQRTDGNYVARYTIVVAEDPDFFRHQGTFKRNGKIPADVTDEPTAPGGRKLFDIKGEANLAVLPFTIAF